MTKKTARGVQRVTTHFLSRLIHFLTDNEGCAFSVKTISHNCMVDWKRGKVALHWLLSNGIVLKKRQDGGIYYRINPEFIKLKENK